MNFSVRSLCHYFPGLCVLTLLVVGCSGGDGARVAGTVKLVDGTPVANVRVTARCDATGKWASGTTDQLGNLTLGTERPGEPIPRGEYTVIVTENQADWDHPTPPKVASKYGSSASSGLKLVIDDTDAKELNLVLDPPD
jgi:hypothetical protein